MRRLDGASSSLAVALLCSVGCSSDVRPMPAMPEGDYDVVYSALSQDCFSARGIVLPPRVLFPPPDSLVTLRTQQNAVTLLANRSDDTLHIRILSLSPPGLVIMRGDMLAQDGERVSGLVMIDTYPGQSTEEPPLCSATASVLMTPSESASSQ